MSKKIVNVKWYILNEQYSAINKMLLTLLTIFITVTVKAEQATEKVQMADGLRSNGKIYVVVAILVTILLGLFIYVIRLDKKISKLEKTMNNNG
jgi:hypothetical protein